MAGIVENQGCFWEASLSYFPSLTRAVPYLRMKPTAYLLTSYLASLFLGVLSKTCPNREEGRKRLRAKHLLREQTFRLVVRSLMVRLIHVCRSVLRGHRRYSSYTYF